MTEMTTMLPIANRLSSTALGNAKRLRLQKAARLRKSGAAISSGKIFLAFVAQAVSAPNISTQPMRGLSVSSTPNKSEKQAAVEAESNSKKVSW